MELYCAVDLLGGGAVRLVQGEYGRRTDYGDPLAVAAAYLAAGARWLHVVDLDAARTGEPVNRDVVLAVVAAAHGAGAAVEVGGGVRTAADVDSLLRDGCDRVVLGTAAVEDPGFAVGCARRHPGRVAVGVDYRRVGEGRLEPAVRGWLAGAGRDLGELLAEVGGAGLAAVVVTAIERDGTGAGPDLEGLAQVLDLTPVPVIASGGVGGLGHLRAIAALRSPLVGRAPAGAVVGRALVDGTIGVEEAMAACAASG